MVVEDGANLADIIESSNEKSLSADNFSALRTLQKAAINEKKLNQNLMSLKIGKPLSFGDPIQLRQ